jgi:hypothetical protein
MAPGSSGAAVERTFGWSATRACQATATQIPKIVAARDGGPDLPHRGGILVHRRLCRAFWCHLGSPAS